MATIPSKERGKLLFETQRKEGLFQIYQVEGTLGSMCYGYYNNVQSVVASTPEMVIIGLSKKHIIGLPEGQLIDFKKAGERIKRGEG